MYMDDINMATLTKNGGNNLSVESLNILGMAWKMSIYVVALRFESNQASHLVEITINFFSHNNYS